MKNCKDESVQTETGASQGPHNLGQPIDVRALLSGEREALLALDGETYRLRITSKGKLILTK